jgi:hypothetical protein
VGADKLEGLVEPPGLRWPWLLSDRGIFAVAVSVAGLGLVGLSGCG